MLHQHKLQNSTDFQDVCEHPDSDVFHSFKKSPTAIISSIIVFVIIFSCVILCVIFFFGRYSVLVLFVVCCSFHLLFFLSHLQDPITRHFVHLSNFPRAERDLSGTPRVFSKIPTSCARSVLFQNDMYFCARSALFLLKMTIVLMMLTLTWVHYRALLEHVFIIAL